MAVRWDSYSLIDKTPQPLICKFHCIQQDPSTWPTFSWHWRSCLEKFFFVRDIVLLYIMPLDMRNCRRNFLSYFASITDPIANLSKWQSYKLGKGVNDKHSQLWNLSHNLLQIMKGVHDTGNQWMDVTFNVSGSRPLWKEASHKVILNKLSCRIQLYNAEWFLLYVQWSISTWHIVA